MKKNLWAKEQYYQNKKETEETAVADTVFWDKSEDIDKKELSKRKKFLKLWNDIHKQIPEVIPNSFDSDKSKNIGIVLSNLRLANIEYYNSQNLTKLRNCRFIEGNMQMLYGTVPQATNCFMQILFLDMVMEYIDIYNIMYLEVEDEYTDYFSDKETVIPKKILNNLSQKAFNEWSKEKSSIAPAIYSWAFQENLSTDKYEKIFKFNAENLIKSLKFDVPVTPDDAWNRIIEYSKTKAT